MAATAARRSARSRGPGASKGTSALAMRLLARVMRCSMALSPTRKARAICGTVRPETMRKRERDLLGRRQLRMAADEEQPQDVVAVLRPVELLGDGLFGIVEIGEHLLGRQRRLLPAAAELVDAGVAPDEDEPGGGIAGRAVHGPGLQRPEAGVLEGLLGRVEIAEIAQQRADGLGSGRAQGGVDPGHVGHAHRRSRGLRSPSCCPARFPGEICRWGGSRRSRRDWPGRGPGPSPAPRRGRRSRSHRSPGAAPWSRRRARRSPRAARCPCARWWPRWWGGAGRRGRGGPASPASPARSRAWP